MIFYKCFTPSYYIRFYSGSFLQTSHVRIHLTRSLSFLFHSISRKTSKIFYLHPHLPHSPQTKPHYCAQFLLPTIPTSTLPEEYLSLGVYPEPGILLSHARKKIGHIRNRSRREVFRKSEFHFIILLYFQFRISLFFFSSSLSKSSISFSDHESQTVVAIVTVRMICSGGYGAIPFFAHCVDDDAWALGWFFFSTRVFCSLAMHTLIFRWNSNRWNFIYNFYSDKIYWNIYHKFTNICSSNVL